MIPLLHHYIIVVALYVVEVEAVFILVFVLRTSMF